MGDSPKPGEPCEAVAKGRCEMPASEDMTQMDTYNFTLILDGDVVSEAVLNRLFEAGLDDGTFGEVDGTPVAEFDREAPSFEEAVVSVIEDIERAGPELRVARVAPDDLVTATAIAQRTGRTRQSINQLIAGDRGPGGFPAPVAHVDAKTRLWRWTEVSQWFERLDGEGDSERRRVAEFIAAINGALESRHHLERLAALGPREEALTAALGLVRSEVSAVGRRP